MKQSDLIGRWVVDPDDAETVSNYGDVSLEFTKDGKLTYTIHLPDKDQKMFLTYELQDDILITDQPSAPGEEKTRVSMLGGKLVLEFRNKRSQYIRSS